MPISLVGTCRARSDEVDYPIVIRPLTEEDGGGYLAVFPDLPGCMSDGDTPEEALANALLALQEWMAAAVSREDMVIPDPGSRAELVARERQAVHAAVGALTQKYVDLDDELNDLRSKIREIEDAIEHYTSWARFDDLVGPRIAAMPYRSRQLAKQ